MWNSPWLIPTLAYVALGFTLVVFSDITGRAVLSALVVHLVSGSLRAWRSGWRGWPGPPAYVSAAGLVLLWLDGGAPGWPAVVVMIAAAVIAAGLALGITLSHPIRCRVGCPTGHKSGGVNSSNAGPGTPAAVA